MEIIVGESVSKEALELLRGTVTKAIEKLADIRLAFQKAERMVETAKGRLEGGEGGDNPRRRERRWTAGAGWAAATSSWRTRATAAAAATEAATTTKAAAKGPPATDWRNAARGG